MLIFAVNVAKGIICCQVEPSIMVLCSTIPILHPLYRKLRGTPRSEESHDYDLQRRRHISIRGLSRFTRSTVAEGTVVVAGSQECVLGESSSVESAERPHTEDSQIKVVKNTVVSHEEQTLDHVSWEEKQISQS